MLQVDLRELARGPVETQGQLAGNDPLFEGLDVVLAEPVHVAGRLHAAGEGRFYWRGSLHTRMAGQCRRCLVPVPVPVEDASRSFRSRGMRWVATPRRAHMGTGPARAGV